jgi:L-fuconolactonase
MIIDAHCHAWEQWPYEPAVPDPRSRARAERLLWEMDQAGVDQAVLISAAIGGNDANAGYTADCAARLAGRLHAFPDVDCRWHPTHHTPGAADRLRQIVARFNPAGFTHYLHEDHDPAWLLSADGLEFFAAADQAGLIASLACGPRQVPTICALAQKFPGMPFLIHHLGRVVVDPPDAQARRAVLAASAAPNIHIKLSGFGFAVREGWNFPQAATHDLVRALYQQFGPLRLCWGSDYPVSQRYMTYRQSLEVVRTHCQFIEAHDMSQILGGNLQNLLARSRHGKLDPVSSP